MSQATKTEDKPAAKGDGGAKGESRKGDTQSGTVEDTKEKGVKKTGRRGSSSPMPMMIMFAAIIAVMYFLMIRPQKKREQARQEMIGRLKGGDKVITASGIVGEVVEVSDLDVVLKIDSRKDVRMRVRKGAIAGVAGDAGSEQAVKGGGA